MASVMQLEAEPKLPKVKMARIRGPGGDAVTGDERAYLRDFTMPRPSLKERLDAGAALRRKYPRGAHGDFKASDDRRDPVAILEKQNATRVQMLTPVRYARMLAGPYAFFRGAAVLMAGDLATTPTCGVEVACGGNVHLNNFGLFTSAERRLSFGINDYDDIHPGPWEWDLKRLAASAAVMASCLGGDDVCGEDAARRAVSSYRTHIRRYAEMGYLQAWYDVIDEYDILRCLPPRFHHRAEMVMDEARARGHMEALERLTEEIGGKRRIVEQASLIERLDYLETGTPIQVGLDRMLRTYVASLPEERRRLLARYRIVDAARKTVGVGSVGLGCWIILMEGQGPEDPLFLQVKQATTSVIAPHVQATLPFQNQGRRVVVGQRMAQSDPDIFLGWGVVDGVDFYVRQVSDLWGGVKFGEDNPDSLNGLPAYCELCGWVLAQAHARSGDPAIIAGYCGESDALDEAIGQFALAYRTQTEKDLAALAAAAKSGRIKVAKLH